MTMYVLKTSDKQGEYLKPNYNGKFAPNGWNHFMHTKRAKVEEYAQKNGINGHIVKVKL